MCVTVQLRINYAGNIRNVAVSWKASITVRACVPSGRDTVVTILDGRFRRLVMLMKKVLVSALFAAGMIGAVAIPLPSVAAVDVYVNIAPPPERFERVPEV